MTNTGLAGTLIVIAAAGLVTYKVMKKKRPELVKKVSDSMTNIKDEVSKAASSAKKEFIKGYESVEETIADTATV